MTNDAIAVTIILLGGGLLIYALALLAGLLPLGLPEYVYGGVLPAWVVFHVWLAWIMHRQPY